MDNKMKHYGVKGQRWGIRRKRNSSSESSDSKAAKVLKKKGLKNLSNEELSKLNKRMQLESTYKDLSKKDTSAGKKFVSDVLRESGKQIASKYVTKVGMSGVSSIEGFFKELKDLRTG